MPVGCFDECRICGGLNCPLHIKLNTFARIGLTGVGNADVLASAEVGSGLSDRANWLSSMDLRLSTFGSGGRAKGRLIYRQSKEL